MKIEIRGKEKRRKNRVGKQERKTNCWKGVEEKEKGRWRGRNRRDVKRIIKKE